MSIDALTVKQFLERVLKQDPHASVSIDEGGICLLVDDTDAYLEIGGQPDEDESNEDTHEDL